MICAVCEADARIVHERKEVPVGQREVVVECEFARCDECGEEFFLAGQLDEAQKAAAAQVRREERLLEGREIFRIREKYGLTQEALEDLIGAGRKTVTRWENDVVFQNATTDTLLRVLRRFPVVVQWLAHKRQVAVDIPDRLFVQEVPIRAFETHPFRASGLASGEKGQFGWVLKKSFGRTGVWADLPKQDMSFRLPSLDEPSLEIESELSG